VKADRPYKSISAEDTFMTDIAAEADLLSELGRIGGTVWSRIEAKGLSGRTVTLKVKYHDFQIVTRARSLPQPIADKAQFLETGAALLRGLLPAPKSIRLLGLGLTNLGEEPRRKSEGQLGLQL
jgi:DNA polymerase-4